MGPVPARGEPSTVSYTTEFLRPLGCCNSTTDWVTSKQQEFPSHSSGMFESGMMWTKFWVADFSLGPHRVEGAGELSQAVFLRALVPSPWELNIGTWRDTNRQTTATVNMAPTVSSKSFLPNPCAYMCFFRDAAVAVILNLEKPTFWISLQMDLEPVSAAEATGSGGRGNTSLFLAVVINDGDEDQAVTQHCSCWHSRHLFALKGSLCHPSGWYPSGSASGGGGHFSAFRVLQSPLAHPFPAWSPFSRTRGHHASHRGLGLALRAHPHMGTQIPCCLQSCLRKSTDPSRPN